MPMGGKGHGGVAFVLGGGGLLGAAEAGMLRALLEAGIVPDVVLGTSIGAINGAAVAADPTPRSVERLVEVWSGLSTAEVFGGSVLTQAATLFRSRTHLHGGSSLRKMMARHVPEGTLIEDLAVPFQCVAASIERACEHWFTSGGLLDAICASAAVPGLFPPVAIGGEHFFDGGLVNSIPIGRAFALGAQTVFVCQVGRIERPLEPPRTPWEVGLVAFEIARRHRFQSELRDLPAGVAVHVLPTGADQPRFSDWSNLRYRDLGRVGDRVDLAYRASAAYLAERDLGCRSTPPD
jgi:NTE family protein